MLDFRRKSKVTCHRIVAMEIWVRSSHELMSSHVHKVIQALGESLYIFGKYMDYEEKYVTAKSKVESLSIENESLKSQVFALAEESKKDKEHLKTLEKSIDTKKEF
ncbi:hypothetical protein SO802_017480 [Lithocarpus litseifolius]|uniref:Uncharacterized protein n=1 Tax=Lithocarpus litseifolius TaxID=425828 RepID=A0AAW2CKE3_9ROSI